MERITIHAREKKPHNLRLKLKLHTHTHIHTHIHTPLSRRMDSSTVPNKKEISSCENESARKEEGEKDKEGVKQELLA